MDEFDLHRFDHQVNWEKSPSPFDSVIKLIHTLLKLVSHSSADTLSPPPPSAPSSLK